MNKKAFIEQARLTGAKGGKSRSKAKKLAARKNLAAHARPGKAVARLKRDVEMKISRNRREWLLANADERVTLDIKFVKLTKLADELEIPRGNGK